MWVSEDYIIRSPFTDTPVPEWDAWTYFENAILKHGDKTATIDAETGESLTFKEFHTKTLKLAKGLISLGFDTRYPLSIYASNSTEYILMTAATWRLGGSVASINPLLTVGEIHKNLKTLSCEFLCCSEMTVDKAIAASENTNIKHIITFSGNNPQCIPVSYLEHVVGTYDLPDLSIKPRKDVALIQFSSGTTGMPKAVECTHRGIVAQGCILSVEGMDSMSECGIVYQPFSHIYGLALWYSLLTHGSKLIVMPQFNLEKYIALVSEYKTREVYVVPPIAVGFCKSNLAKKYDLSEVKTIICTAAPLGKNVEEEILKQLGGKVAFRQVYGLTETCGAGTMVPSKRMFPNEPCPSGSVGLPMSRVTAKVIDLSTGSVLPPNKEGEILLKCDHKMKGYKDNKKATDNMIDTEGWVHTGDIGYYDDNGYIFIVDRLKELIKYKGYQVAPAEIEALLLKHPDIADSGVTALQDEECGELPLAWVVRRQHANITEADIKKFVSDNAAPYKKLRGGVKFVDTIPKSPTGKILRREIKRLSAAKNAQ